MKPLISKVRLIGASPHGKGTTSGGLLPQEAHRCQAESLIIIELISKMKVFQLIQPQDSNVVLNMEDDFSCLLTELYKLKRYQIFCSTSLQITNVLKKFY